MSVRSAGTGRARNNPALRINLSVAEEAVLPSALSRSVSGDRVEAAKLFGLVESKLDARLLLLHATERVDALTERKIKLGHAGLLAAFPVTQDRTLADYQRPVQRQ